MCGNVQTLLALEFAMSSDLELRQDVLDELEFEPSVNAAHIGVTANHGVVTLTGFVTNYAEKTMAERAARMRSIASFFSYSGQSLRPVLSSMDKPAMAVSTQSRTFAATSSGSSA